MVAYHPSMRHFCAVLSTVAVWGAGSTALATEKLPTGPVPKVVTGPYGTRLRAPATQTACASDGMVVPVSARWSARAIARPVRSIRVLLQRPGSEAVMASAVFAPARPSTTRRATLRISTCRQNLDVRYELFVGRDDVAHDHVSVAFRTHGTPAA